MTAWSTSGKGVTIQGCWTVFSLGSSKKNGVMIQGYITLLCVGTLCRVNRNCIFEKYTDILDNNLWPGVKGHFRDYKLRSSIYTIETFDESYQTFWKN